MNRNLISLWPHRVAIIVIVCNCANGGQKHKDFLRLNNNQLLFQ